MNPHLAVSIVDPNAPTRMTARASATGADKETDRGAEDRRRTTGAQIACLETAPAPCHPALRFSGIVRKLFRLGIAQAAFDLESIGLADPTIDGRCIPKNGSQCRALGLIVGVDLTHGGLD